MVGLGADATLIAPNRPRIVRKEIALRRWPSRLDGFTIAMVSDFHYDPYFSIHPIRASIGMVNDLHPELIVLTGDFVSDPLSRHKAEAALAAEPCAQLGGIGKPRRRDRSAPGHKLTSGRGNSSPQQSIGARGTRWRAILAGLC